MDRQAVLDQLHVEHGLDCSILQSFEGFNGGTVLLRTTAGEELILKTWPHRSLAWAIQAHRAIEAARRDGWPSPAWRLKGATADGLTFSVQERGIGTPVSHIDELLAHGIVEANRHQHDRATRDAELFDYGERVKLLLFDDLNDWKAKLRAYSGAADQLVNAVLARVASSTELGGNDLVHGDYSRVNVLAVDGSITALVDVDNLGWGNRAIDLADAYRQMVLLDDPPGARQIIRREIEAAATAEGFYAGFAFWTIANLAWAIDAKPEYVEERTAKLQTFVNSEEF